MPMYSSIKSILVLLFAFVFLTACGGGGGGTTTPTVTPVAPTVTIDPTGQVGVSVVNGIVTVTAPESGVGAGRLLASFTIPAGDSPITSVVLNEVVSPRGVDIASRSATDYFEAVISEDGSSIEIRVKDDAGTIPPGTYKVTLVITNSTGGQQTFEAEIVVSDVAEPVIAANQTFSIIESASTGDAVGTLTFTNEDSAAIAGIALTDQATGTASTDFASDNEGKITVLSTASLDFESDKKSYTLSAVISSDGGASDAETITVSVGDAPDDLPSVTAKDYEVLEGRASGTIIDTLEFDRGSSDVTFALGGADAASFTLDNTGVLKLAATAVANTTYALTATATNSIGDSNVAAINVAVIAAASWVGQTPTLMAIGDSITQGIGGVSEAELATIVANATADLDAKTTAATAAATADTKAAEALASLGVDPAVPTAQEFTDSATAAAAAETAATGTSAATATAAARTAIDASAAAPTDPDLLDAARTAATDAKAATDSALTTANAAKDAAQTALNNTKFTSVQRLSYRKDLGDKKGNGSGVEFSFIGSTQGPISSQDGSLLFLDSKHEGYAGFLIRQMYDVAAEYTCTQERVDEGVCQQVQLGTAITGGPHPDAGNVDGKSYLGYVFEDLKLIPDVAFVMLGTNDMAFRISYADPIATAKADMEGLIEVLRKANPKMSIFIAQIPPIDDPYGFGFSSASVVPFNSAIADIVTNDSHATSQLFVVDQYTGFIGSGSEEDPIKDDLHVGDGVHPNTAGEAILAQNWFTALKQNLFPSIMMTLE